MLVATLQPLLLLVFLLLVGAMQHCTQFENCEIARIKFNGWRYGKRKPLRKAGILYKWHGGPGIILKNKIFVTIKIKSTEREGVHAFKLGRRQSSIKFYSINSIRTMESSVTENSALFYKKARKSHKISL